MDTLKFRNIIEKLDREVEVAKKEAAVRKRREEFEGKLRLLDHWRDGLLARVKELEALGAKTSLNLEPELAEIAREKKALEEEFASDKPPPDVSVPLEILYREVTATHLSHDDAGHGYRWKQYEKWALRWRILAEEVGQEEVKKTPIFGRIYGRLLQRIDGEKVRGPFIRALDQKKAGNWKEELIYAETVPTGSLSEEGEDRLYLLMNLVERKSSKYLDEDLREIRKIMEDVSGRFPHLKPELAEIVSRHRGVIEPFFPELWKNGHPEAPPKDIYSRREVVDRLLLRLRAHGYIGGAYGPYDRLTEGFPDAGKAKASMDALIQSGIVHKKSSVLGSRIAIEGSALPNVLRFLDNGEALGIGTADFWMAEA